MTIKSTCYLLLFLLTTALVNGQEVKILSSDGQEDDRFGRAISIHNNELIVGANGVKQNGIRIGAAYLYNKENDNWNEVDKLLPQDTTSDKYFGREVFLNDSLLLISAVNGDEGESSLESIFIYNRTNDTWVFDEEISIGSTSYSFGRNIDFDNQYLVVGALGDSNDAFYGGAAYVYKWTPSNWEFITRLAPNTPNLYTEFGVEVSISNDHICIGSPKGSNTPGSAFVYKLVNEEWILQNQLFPNNSPQELLFGSSVAINDSTLVIGAPWFGEGNELDRAGAVFIYNNINSNWEQSQMLQADNPAARWLGGNLFLSDNYLVATAPYSSIDGITRSGAVYLFQFDGNQWNEILELTPSDTHQSQFLGNKVDLSNNKLAIGASLTLDAEEEKTGAVYIFDLDILINQVELYTSTKSDINLFPNPTSGRLSISKNESQKINSISVFNMQGAFLQSVKSPSDHLDLSKLSNGTYFVKIKTDHITFTKKIIIVN